MKFIFLLIVLFVVGCSIATSVTQDSTKEGTTPYRIKKIRKKGSTYIIHAERNDSIFKIVSLFDETICTNCNRIKVNGKYILNLKQAFLLDSLFGMSVAPNLGIKGIGLPGGKVLDIDKRTLNRIYCATNLNGLRLCNR